MDRIIEGLCEKYRGEHSLSALGLDELFESFCAYSVISSIYEEEFDAEEFRLGQGGDLGVDAVAILINGDLLLDANDVRQAVAGSKSLDVTFVVVQARSGTSFEAKTIVDLTDNLLQLFTADSVPYPMSSGVTNFHQSVVAIYSDIGKLKTLPNLKVYYVTTGRVTEDAHLKEKRKSSATRLADTNYFDDVSWNLLGARELRDMYQRATTAVTADISMPKRVSLARIPGVQQAFLGILPATELVRMVTDVNNGIRKSVFYENVRDFQDYNPVNLEIQGTVRDADRRDRFAVLNNGITIVAREISSAGDDLQIRDFQIVNGCQTCHVLFDEQENLSPSMAVPIKLVETRDEDVIANITAATNRQTAVTDEDLAAQERFHKELEALFVSFPEPERLYYERRTRQYSAEDGLEKTRIVTRGQLTRTYSSMFLDEPARAGRYYKELRSLRKDDLFKEGQSTYVYYASAAAAYRIDWLLRNKRIDKKYATAKYQLLMAIKHYIHGPSPIAASPRKAEAQCKRITAAMWSVPKSEEIIKLLLNAVDAAVSLEDRPLLDRDTVRTQRFTDALQNEVSKLPVCSDDTTS